MIRVCLESPYSGDRERNVRYLRACLLDSLERGEAPFASHGLYPPVLDDNNPSERMMGLMAGALWRKVAEYTVVYTDLGISPGMEEGVQHASVICQRVEYRQLGKDWDK
jgi:hypothetical protein